MKKDIYTLMKKGCQLVAIIGVVIILSIGVYALSRILKPQHTEPKNDEAQIDEMRNYHQSQGRTNLLFF